jgi:hypothetical protein
MMGRERDASIPYLQHNIYALELFFEFPFSFGNMTGIPLDRGSSHFLGTRGYGLEAGGVGSRKQGIRINTIF